MSHTAHSDDSPASSTHANGGEDDLYLGGGSSGVANGSGSGASSSKAGKGLNRTSRACNNCRKQKMRCIGAENPPCKRCRNGGLECMFEKPLREGAQVGEERIKQLEGQVTSIQSTLAELVSTLKAANPAAAHAPASKPPSSALSYALPSQNNNHSYYDQYQHPSQAFPPSQSFDPSQFYGNSSSSNDNPHAGGGSGSTTTGGGGSSHFQTFSPTGSHTSGGRRSSDGHDSAQRPVNTFAGAQGPPVSGGSGSRPGGPLPDASGSGTSRSLSIPEDHPYPLPPPIPSRSTSSTSTNPYAHAASSSIIGGAPSSSNAGPLSLQHAPHNPFATLPPLKHHRQAYYDAAFPSALHSHPRPTSSARTTPAGSPAPSEVDETEIALKPDLLLAPLGSMDEPVANLMLLADAGRATKRARLDDPMGKQRERERLQKEKDELMKIGDILTGPDGKMLDCIDVGLISMDEAKELFELYWSGASRFLPVYDRETDTFESLRIRSPFSISAICYVASRIRDGGEPKSEIQHKLWAYVRRISQESLFKGTLRTEGCQATILIAGWNDSGWLLGGHAVRLAFEMGCHTAFLRLARNGMGARSSAKGIEEDRALVIMARTWYCLYVLEHQMSYGHGRPPIVREDETILRCREFLNHPLTIESDWHLIATVELMAIRAPLHLELSELPENAPVGVETFSHLQQANQLFEKWYKDWLSILGSRFKDANKTYEERLRIQRSYAELFHNCTALREVRGPADVANMRPTQKELAIRALRNAQQCLDICVRGKTYRDSLTYAVHYAHVCAAFAASLLIRLARIFPTELDLRQTARDVEALARILASVPAGRYARSLRLTLRSARRRKVIPPPSVPGSPTSMARQQGLPSTGATTAAASTPMFSPSDFKFGPSVAGTPARFGEGGAGVDAGSLEEESPQADFNLDFDFGYTSELMDKVGLTLDGGQQIPLWLHGSDIGSSQLPSAGMENFFLPSDLDFRLSQGNGKETPKYNNADQSQIW